MYSWNPDVFMLSLCTHQFGIWTWALPCRIFGPLSWMTHLLLGKKISGLCLMDQDWKMATHPHHLGQVVLRLGKWRCCGLQGCHPVQREVQVRIVQTWKSSLPLCAHPEWLWLGHCHWDSHCLRLSVCTLPLVGEVSETGWGLHSSWS